jgi:formylglycine-generating enzyme required for sulfatase activity
MKKVILTTIVIIFISFGCTENKTQEKIKEKPDLGINWVLVEGNGKIKSFYISATELTFEKYDRFCGATGYKQPRDQFGRGNQPVTNVDVNDAVAYCKWASSFSGKTIRLPQEDEWEYAAKGGNKSKGYKYSGSDNLDDVAWYGGMNHETVYGPSWESPHVVGGKKPNELGIYDMTGNVYEWCGNFGDYRGGAFDSWFNRDESYLVETHPQPERFDFKRNDFGFRVIRDVE